MSVDINLLCGGAAIVGTASALLYARRKRWPDAALAAAAGVSLAALLAAPTAPGGAGGPVILDTEAWTSAPAAPRAANPASGARQAAAPTSAAPSVAGRGAASATSTVADVTPDADRTTGPAAADARVAGAGGAVVAPSDKLAASLAALPAAASVVVQGHGLHEAQWRDLPVRPMQWQPSQDGLLWLDFPRTLPLGRSFALTARRGGKAQAGWRLQLLAENGQVLAEARAAAAAEALTVQWQPPMAESMVLQARLLDQDGKAIAQGPLPLRVLDAVPLQVQGRFGAPSFDTRVLNQLLTDSNAIVDWQTTLGKSLTRSEEARAPLAHPNALVADAAWLERGGLRTALAQVAQGLPLLVLGGNADDAAMWQRELGLRLAAQSATTEREDLRHLALGAATLAMAPGGQLPVAGGGAAWQAVARDKDGKPWLWQRDWQKGRILWLGVRDWHRHAISEPAALGAWWQQVLDQATVGSEQKVRWIDAEPMPLAGLRSEVCAQGVAAGSAVTAGQESLRWQARSERADAACVALWPRKAGWMPLASGGERSELYVFGASDWPAWQAALRHEATARYVGMAAQPVAQQNARPGSAPSVSASGRAAGATAAGAIGAGDSAAVSAAAPDGGALANLVAAVPRWLLGVAFAASLLALWWRERR